MNSNVKSLEPNVQPKGQATEKAKKPLMEDTSKKIVMRHLNSFLDNNLEAVLSDYTHESVLITQAATYTTLEEIRAFFVGLNIHFPKQQSEFALDKLEAKDDLVYIVWHAKTPTLEVPIGSDSFIIKDGKIFQQTFVGQLNFIDQSPPKVSALP